MPENIGQNPVDINEIFANPNLSEDSRWANSPFASLPIIDYATTPRAETQQRQAETRVIAQRVLVHTKYTPNLPTLLQSLYQNEWAPRLAELLVNSNFEKAEILEGVESQGLRYLSGKTDLGVDVAIRELLVEYTEKKTSSDLNAFVVEVTEMDDIPPVYEYEIDRVWMDSGIGHPKATFRFQATSPNGLSLNSPIVDLIGIKDGRRYKDITIALPAKALVYFGFTSFNNCFVTVEAKK